MENNSSNQASEPLNIDAISIDLKLPMPVKDKGKCQHFSIRGYVTETRKRDIKLCSPFGSSSDHIKLPKLDVPKFKWWRCDECILEIGGEPVGDEVGNVSSHDRTCISGVAYLLTETKDISNSKKQEGNKETLYDDDGLILLSFKRNKAIDGAVQNKIVKAVNSSDDGAGDGAGLNNVGKEKICNPVANQLNTSTTVALSEPTLSTDGNGKVASHDNRDGNIDMREEKGPQNDEQRIASVTSNQIEVLGSKDKVLKTGNLKSSGLASHESRKDTKTSKGSDENLAESRQCHLDKDTAARNWKMELLKKMCRLTDELAKEPNLKAICANAERRSSNAMPVVPKDKISFPTDVGQGTTISQTKRKMPQEDGSKSEMMLDGKLAKRLRASMGIKIDDSPPGENGLDRERLQNGSKSLQIAHRSDTDNGANNNKDKQVLLDSECSPRVALKGKSIDTGTKGYGANSVLFHPGGLTSGSVEHNLRNNHASLLGKERNSILSRDNNRFLDVRDASALMNVNPRKPNVAESSQPSRRRVTFDLSQGSATISSMWQETQRRHPQVPKLKEMPHHFSKGSLNEGQVQSYAIKPQRNLVVENQQKPSNSWQVSAPAPSVLGLQHGEGSEPAWFPTGRSITLGQFPCSLQKGKTISDIKGGELERQREQPQSLQKPRNSEHNNKSLRSSRPSSSESVAALQLLGLMDQSTPSSLALNVDANKLKENPFTPCNYHPQIPLDVQKKILNGSSLSHLRSKEFSGIYVAGPSSRKTLPNVNDQVSFVSQVKEKTSKSYSHVQLGKRKMLQAASSIGIFRRPRSESVPGKDKSRGLVGTSCSTPVLLQDGNSSKSLDVGASSTPLTLLPVSVFPEMNPPCLFNQNPADISFVDDDKSPYIRTSEDQNIQNRISAGEKLGGVHSVEKSMKGVKPFVTLQSHAVLLGAYNLPVCLFQLILFVLVNSSNKFIAWFFEEIFLSVLVP